MRNHHAASSHWRLLWRITAPGVLALGVLWLAFGDGATSVAAKEKKPTTLRPFHLLAKVKKEARIELGRRLFFEPAASPSGLRSCASCHLPEHGFSDPKRVSIDDFGETRRHSQPILDTAHNPTAHWDGEFKGVADLVDARLSTTPFSGSYGGRGGAMPMRGGFLKIDVETKKKEKTGKDEEPKEEKVGTDFVANLLKKFFEHLKAGTEISIVHNTSNFSNQVPVKLKQSGRYREGFQAAFGSHEITLERIGAALDAFCKTIESTEAPYDRFRAGDETALSDAARRGLRLFEGKAGCADCHLTTPHAKAGKPLFTDFAFHNTGVALEDARTAKDQPHRPAIQALRLLQRGMLKSHMKGERGLELTADHGHMAVSAKTEHLRAFKTPTLRDVAKRGPYMHNGRFATLGDVIRYYAKGGGEDKRKDAKLEPFEVTDEEVADLVAFLKSLSGDVRPGLASKAWQKRAKKTTLQFIDWNHKPLRGLVVTVKPVGDPLPGTAGTRRVMTTDAKGKIEFEHGATTHTELGLPEDLIPVGGPLVPDTCRNAKVRVPIKGRMKLTLTFSKDHEVPEKIVARHGPGFSRRGFRVERRVNGEVTVVGGNGLQRPVTNFIRTGVVTVKDTQVARYEGWVRADAVPQVVLEVPGIIDGPKKHRPSLVLAPDQEMRLDLSSF